MKFSEAESQQTNSKGPNPILCFTLLTLGFMLWLVFFWSVVLWTIEPEHPEVH